MSYFDVYKSRLQASGNSQNDATINNTKQFVSNSVHNSLSSQSIKVNDIDFMAIVTNQDKSEKKKLLFEPETIIEIGSQVEINSKNYLVVDFLGDGINEIYPTAEIQLCNSTFQLKGDKTEILIGYDSYGRPRYKDDYIYTPVPCIAETKTYRDSNEEIISLPQGQIKVTLQYTLSDSFKINDEFEMYESKWKVIDLDYTKVINNKGLITITAERVVND